QGGAPLIGWLPTFTEERWGSDVLRLLMWIGCFAIAVGAASAAGRWQRRPTSFAPVAAFAIVGVAMAATLPGRQPVRDRQEFAIQGQTRLLHDYDASRLRAVDIRQMRRLAEPALFERLTIHPAPDVPVN